METTFFRFASEKDRKHTVFSQASLILLCITAAWLAIVFFFQSGIAQVMDYPGYERHVVVLGLIIALDILVAVPFAAFRLEGRPVRYTVLRLLGILINIIAVIFFLEVVPYFVQQGAAWTSWYDHADRLYYVFLSNLFGSLVVFCLFIPGYLRIQWKWNGELALKMLKYALPLVIVGVAGVINQSSFITFQKYILPFSVTENLAIGGVYAAATRIAILMSLFTTAFNYAAEPFFFEQSKSEGARQTYADVAKAFAIIASLLMTGILLYLDVIQYVLGESFRSGLYILPVLLLGFLFLGLYYNVSVWYKVTDKTHLGALISACASVITIVLNILLIRSMGVAGSAWTALICYAFMVTACYFLGRKYYPVPYDLARIAVPVAGGLIVYWLNLLLRDLTGDVLWLTLLINTMLLGAYGLVLYRMEGSLIRSIIRRSPVK
jgi:O-antigen/teichoic acid export membrane protein